MQAALFELQAKIFLNSRAWQPKYGTNTEEEIRFKNRRRTCKTAEK